MLYSLFRSLQFHPFLSNFHFYPFRYTKVFSGPFKIIRKAVICLNQLSSPINWFNTVWEISSVLEGLRDPMYLGRSMCLRMPMYIGRSVCLKGHGGSKLSCYFCGSNLGLIHISLKVIICASVVHLGPGWLTYSYYVNTAHQWSHQPSCHPAWYTRNMMTHKITVNLKNVRNIVW